MTHANHLPDYSRFSQNALDLGNEMAWMENIVLQRMKDLHTQNYSAFSIPEQFPAPTLGDSDYGKFIRDQDFSYVERLTIILCFAAHYRPGIMKHFMIPNLKTNERFPEVGGVTIKDMGSFMPTLQTAFFTLSGTDNEKDTWYHYVLNDKNRVFTDGIVMLKKLVENEPHLPFYQMKIDPMYYNHFLTGKRLRLDQTESFPARLLETKATWDDVVLSAEALDQLQRVIDYVQTHQRVSDKTQGEYQGMVLLLYGLPGTGKTLTASLLGKHLGIDTYHVDMSMVTSKFVGETEKKINEVFDRFEGRNAILFFDEADALFGKRSEVHDSQDRYNNQEVANLLIRLNDCKNLVILASNFKQNMDEAFQRRIIIEVELERPDPEERLRLWQTLLKAPYAYDSPETLTYLSKYSTTGANIYNILKVCVHQAEAQGSQLLTRDDLYKQLHWELAIKERKSPHEMMVFPEKAMKSRTRLN